MDLSPKSNSASTDMVKSLLYTKPNPDNNEVHGRGIETTDQRQNNEYYDKHNDELQSNTENDEKFNFSRGGHNIAYNTKSKLKKKSLTIDETKETLLVSPPKMTRQVQDSKQSDSNDIIESVTSLQFSSIETDTNTGAHEDDDDLSFREIDNAISSQHSAANISVNTSGGGASSVLGYKFLPSEYGAIFSDDEGGGNIDQGHVETETMNSEKENSDNDSITVNTEAAIAGSKRLNKYQRKKSKDTDKLKLAATSENFATVRNEHHNAEISPTNQNNKNGIQIPPNPNRKDNKIDFPLYNQTYNSNDLDLEIEDCNSNESIMGSEHRSESSSRFEGTVIENSSMNNIRNTRGAKLKKIKKGKKSGNLGITAELLRAMEEEQKDMDENLNKKNETMRANIEGNDKVGSSTTPPPRFETNSLKDSSTQKSIRRKKMDVFPLTTPPSRNKSISPVPLTEKMVIGKDGILSPLALPTLEPTESLKQNRTEGTSTNKDIVVEKQLDSIYSTKTFRSNPSSPKINNDKKSILNQNLLSPFHRARQCLSVDNDDIMSSVAGGAGGAGGHELKEKDTENERSSRLWKPITSQSSTYFDTSKSARKNIEYSKSWDVGGNRRVLFEGKEESKHLKDKFTTDHQKLQNSVSDLNLNIRNKHHKKERAQSFSTTKENFLKSHEFSPAVRNDRNFTVLQSPRHIEHERDDALDILACLVERSLAFHNHINQTNMEITFEKSLHAAESKSTGKISPQSSPHSPKTPGLSKEIPQHLARSTSFSSTLNAAVEALQMISLNHEKNLLPDKESDLTPNHSSRMKALDNLVRSHTYALEMKRAALGASKWLDTIRNEKRNVEREAVSRFFSPQTNITNMERKEFNEKGISENKIMIELRLRLIEAEKKNLEMEENKQRLDDELSKCRAEIGRLKSSTRAEVLFTSPNRSILDIDDDDSSASSASDGVKDDFKVLEDAFQDVSDVLESNSFKISKNKLKDDTKSKREVVLLQAELQKLRTQLESSKNLKFTHADNESGKQEDPNSNVEVMEEKLDLDIPKENVSPPVTIYNESLANELKEFEEAIRKEDELEIESLKNQLEKLQNEQKKERENQENLKTSEKSFELPNPNLNSEKLNSGAKKQPITPTNDEKTINVRMLDAENFVTEWDSLAQPLPPPPDHGLRSPIVDALLLQWTSDSSMHDSLLAWMDQVMEGKNPNEIPPLQIASLDHQVRDGFAMHVLPLLLRRSDINVEVTTRAHRTTTYDIAVVVTSSTISGEKYYSERDDPILSKHSESAMRGMASSKQMMAFKASSGAHDRGIDGRETSMKDAHSFGRGMTGFWRSNASENDNVSATSTSLTSPVSNRNNSNIGNNIGTRGYRSEEKQQNIYDQSRNQINYNAHHNSNPPSSGFSVGSHEESIGSNLIGANSHRNLQSNAGPGIMSAIGGAFGGLLGRSKKPTSATSNHQRNRSGDNEDYDHTWNKDKERVNNMNYSSFKSGTQQSNNAGFRQPQSLSPAGSSHPSQSHNQSHSSIASQVDDYDHPYHRVVSAPSGRIGVTFVQFRGHAMVSDISPDSPLSGWVFPSDILIAIDEVPVSGMRVRDIVKLLTTRKERQRALRMISTHAMEELTQPPFME